MEEKEKKLYTLLVYSENIAGLLNQITAVFTRRQLNIESINVSASSLEGVHKYTITAWSNEEQILLVTKQIEKKIDVIKADYYTDEQLFIREVGLFKLATQKIMDCPEITRILRHADAHILEVNPTFCVAMQNGKTEEITGLYSKLQEYSCVLQYTRSGRIAITRNPVEEVSDFLKLQEERENDKQQ